MARHATDVVTGRARVDRRTKELLTRIQPGEVAVIDHADLDRLAAEGLVQARPAAVVNVVASITGRYPNVGPLLLAAAGIPLVDEVGAAVLDRVGEGVMVRVEDNRVLLGEAVVATGTRHTLASLEARYEEAKVGLGEELERFAENTLEFIRREGHLLLDAPSLRQLDIDMRGRHALVVVRGADYRSDLAHLRGYVREMRPVLVAVDGAADALLDVGLKPDLIVGDFDSVSNDALKCGARLVVHAYAGGAAPGAARLDRLGASYTLVESAGTSEDVAMLLAYENGAELIVAVGTHASMVEFLDKGRPGMASTFLVRMKVGPILVDAKGLSRLYESRIRKRDLVVFLFAVMLAFVVAGIAFYPLRVFFGEGAGLVWDSLFR